MTLRTRISSAASWVALVAVAVLLGLGLLALVLRVEALDGALEESRTDRSTLHSELNEQEAASQALAEQVKRLGGKPVVDPPDTTTPPPALGPTDAQVQDAVKVICAGTSACVPTKAQVTAALRAICGDCRGDDAAPATDGRNGADGEDAPAVTDAQIDAAVARNCGVEGCRGPGPTDQQVDDRIAAYCTNGGDCGEKGDKGDKGDTGSVTPGDYTCPDGEWITAIHVAEGGSMTVDCAPLIGRE
ncbi:MAG: hypothetical protein ACRDQD_00525 [Nocardioidaceae bacterium]